MQRGLLFLARTLAVVLVLGTFAVLLSRIVGRLVDSSLRRFGGLEAGELPQNVAAAGGAGRPA